MELAKTSVRVYRRWVMTVRGHLSLIWTQPRAKGDCLVEGEGGCSHIFGLCVELHFDAPGLDGNPRAFSWSPQRPRGPRDRTGLESAGPTGYPSLTKRPPQPWRDVFL